MTLRLTDNNVLNTWTARIDILSADYLSCN